jgi:hypothetical protein
MNTYDLLNIVKPAQDSIVMFITQVYRLLSTCQDLLFVVEIFAATWNSYDNICIELVVYETTI